jgi:hypothetical protein
MVAPNFYNQVDQNIYNQGYSFIPQERYRGDPLILKILDLILV